MLLAGGLLEATALGRGMAMGKAALSRGAQLLTGWLPSGHHQWHLVLGKQALRPEGELVAPHSIHLSEALALPPCVRSGPGGRAAHTAGPMLVASPGRLGGWDLRELSGWRVRFHGRSFRLAVWPGFRGNIILRNFHNGNSRNIKILPAC